MRTILWSRRMCSCIHSRSCENVRKKGDREMDYCQVMANGGTMDGAFE
jgi:hypothetical protein